MMLLTPLLLVAAAGLCSACNGTKLFVASYAGSVTTLSLSLTSNNTYQLQNVSRNTDCAPSPSWLTLDKKNNVLYCADEGLSTPGIGSLTSLSVSQSGYLTKLDHAMSNNGGVSSVVYGGRGKNGSQALALAHYGGSALTTWELTPTGTLSLLQNITFNLTTPGPNSAQTAPHPHQAILDPTGQYVLVPDLGADLVRIFCIDPETNELASHEPLEVEAGSGPRHATFWSPQNLTSRTFKENSTLYFYLLSELASTISSYSVTYPASGGLSFTKLYSSATYGNSTPPAGIAAAEVQIRPSHSQYLLLSNRNDSTFSLPNIDPANSTHEASDSLATFELNNDGTLLFKSLWPSGGTFPRQFQINAKGDMVAVADQTSNRIVIMKRDAETGEMGYPIAYWVDEAGEDGTGQVTCVIWDE
ncbi:MAG: hypothetical protein M1834_007516 [Cirrosporium novae-zelandiae]|nr:MAG: hypothetical protein M1834_007516 [Cirrosporium novae-zelandiae]